MESNNNADALSAGVVQPEIQFEIFTLFPDVFEPYLGSSILQRARQGGFMDVHCHNIRDWAVDRHHITDDEPFGGGGGMVLKPEPLFAAVESIFGSPPDSPVILLTPQGRLFTQKAAEELLDKIFLQREAAGSSGFNRLGLICGRYEGVDERVRSHLVSDEISIGDYVLTGGELAAMVIVDALTRLIPGVLGDPSAVSDDSHAAGLLEYPHYTRPGVFRGWSVPEVLLSGDHARIDKWRRQQALLRTWRRRPDLLDSASLSEDDLKFLSGLDIEEVA